MFYARLALIILGTLLVLMTAVQFAATIRA